MDRLHELTYLAERQSDTSNATSTVAQLCLTGNDYNGHLGARVSSVFVILVGSMVGVIFPIVAHRRAPFPEWIFIYTKYFGYGVIIATAFIHLLAPADSELSDPCLAGPITEYSWAEGIVLITVFMLFSLQLFAKIVTRKINPNIHFSGRSSDDVERYSDQNVGVEDSDLSRPGHEKSCPAQPATLDDCEIHSAPRTGGQNGNRSPPDDQKSCPAQSTAPHIGQNPGGQNRDRSRDSYAAKLIAVLILEFGIIFHSFFIGFNLAVAGDEFFTLYIVIIFHQLFEGLALGSRLANNPFLEEHKGIQYSMGFLYGLTTPIAIAIGLGVRTDYSPGSQTALVLNGIFDSISAGILIYTGLVDLMAREFLFLDAPNPFRAWGTMCLGAGKGLFLLACGLISSLSVFLQRSWPSSANGPRFSSFLRFCRERFVETERMMRQPLPRQASVFT